MSSGKRILIIGDDPSEVWMMGQGLLGKGFLVTATTCESDGFRQLERRQFDCLIVDGGIEEASLFTLLAYCSRYFSEMKTIVIIDSGADTAWKKELLAGASYFVPAPVDMEVIYSIIFGRDVDKSPVGASS